MPYGTRRKKVNKMKEVPCEVYSRIVGYFRPVHNWNTGKKQEFSERIEFSEKMSLTKTV